MQKQLFEKAEAEVRDLHRFFVTWFRKETAQDASFDRFDLAMAPGFQMVPPDGGILDRPTIINEILASRARRVGEFTIEIEDVRMLWSARDEIMVSYIEAQFSDGAWSRRRSSALLARDALAPMGLVWVFLQETWLPAAG